MRSAVRAVAVYTASFLRFADSAEYGSARDRPPVALRTPALFASALRLFRSAILTSLAPALSSPASLEYRPDTALYRVLEPLGLIRSIHPVRAFEAPLSATHAALSATPRHPKPLCNIQARRLPRTRWFFGSLRL